jgi:CRISPR-associated protein Cas5d
MTVRFWNPVMKDDGIIDFIPPEECTIKRHIKEMPIKPFGQLQGNFSGLDEFEESDFIELG